MMNSIEVRNAEKYYGSDECKNKVLNGLNMNIRPGTIYSLIGASGCGKTTLLSCILGMKNLDSGTIKVLGHTVNHEKTSKVAHLIGYMPQNTALIPELTIRETLYYFGNIFQMNGNLLKERYKMINDLLELPNEYRKIENLSGGQQRRVSIAASIIHNPLILILDEPTVGLDSLLRDKIWNFLLEATRSRKLSVIITTHYISEAEKAHSCGLMRDGVLLAEDSPKNILSRCGAESLDEAFLNLCLLKKDFVPKNDTELNYLSEYKEDEKIIEEVNGSTIESFEKRKKFSKQTILALLKKEFIRIRRQPGEIFFILILPILQMLIFAYGIGGNPIGLKIGIVNNEVQDFSECSKYLSQNASFLDADYECVYNEKSSCHFLNEIHDDDAIKVFYDSYEQAFEDAKKAEITGILILSANFTNILQNPQNSKSNQNNGAGLTIQIDQTNFQVSKYLSYRIYNAYLNFNAKLSVGCGQSKKAADIPLNFEETLFGSLNNDFRKTILPPMISQILMFPAIGFTSYSIAQSRIDGVWNRTLLSGVKTSEILIMQILLSLAVVTFSFIETIVTGILTVDIVMIGNYGLFSLFLFLFCLTGSIMGITLSATNDNVKVIALVFFAISNFFSNLSGSFWPLEGQPDLLRYFSYTLPTSLPAVSVRNIMLKGYGITHPSVYIGILILLAWIVVSIISSLIIMSKRKFAET